MSSEALFSNIVPFAGSGLLGYAMGFALKKVLVNASCPLKPRFANTVCPVPISSVPTTKSATNDAIITEKATIVIL
jgi:hypothetical protein